MKTHKHKKKTHSMKQTPGHRLSKEAAMLHQLDINRMLISRILLVTNRMMGSIIARGSLLCWGMKGTPREGLISCRIISLVNNNNRNSKGCKGAEGSCCRGCIGTGSQNSRRTGSILKVGRKLENIRGFLRD